MKKSLHFALVMAMGMMAMSPASAWAEDVATLNVSGHTVSYDNLVTAVHAASIESNAENPATVTVLADVSNTEGGQYFLEVPSGVVTLDLNGHTLSMTSNQSVLAVTGGDLTIVDNSANKTGKLYGNYCALDFQMGKLTVCGGTYEGNYSLSAATWGIPKPGAIALRGGTFIYRPNSVCAIGVNYHQWNVLDLDGYALMDIDTHEIVELFNGDGSYLEKSVKVVSVDDPEVSFPASVTVGGKTTKCGVKGAFVAAAAGTAESPATITLLDDYINTADPYNSYVSVESGSVVILDLNDHTMGATKTGYTISVKGGDLTIVDNGINKTGKVTNDKSIPVHYETGSLAIYGGTYEGKSHGLYMPGCDMNGQELEVVPGSVVLRGGTFIMGEYSSIQVPNFDSNHWEILDMEGYKFVDANTGEDVVINEEISVIQQSVKVVPEVSTSINGVKIEGSKAVKTIENGQLVITKDGKRYNAAGQMMK
ncbi:MAG: hypothetical protein KBT13_01410 [Bacteroidales bacterium]|nr:hypothetical protein [Candidatus Sodaliphilus limicaballi]